MKPKARAAAVALAVTMTISLLQYPTITVRANEIPQATEGTIVEDSKTTDVTASENTSGEKQGQEKDESQSPTDINNAGEDNENMESQKPSSGDESILDNEESDGDGEKNEVDEKDNLEGDDGDITDDTGTENDEILPDGEQNPDIIQDSTTTDVGAGMVEEESVNNVGIETVVAEASGTCGENLKWTLVNGILTISGTGNIQGDEAWRYNDNIVSVILSSGVTGIGEGAFWGCSQLNSINLSDTLTSIGADAFNGCHLTTSLKLPRSITSIGNFAFRSSGLTNIVIPDSVTSIGAYAFSNCDDLTRINIPSSVTSIGEHAFDDCSKLINITVPDGIISIENFMFNGCSSLTSIELPETITSIGNGAFYGCGEMANIKIPNSVTNIGYNAFSYCYNLTNIEIPANVTSIGNDAFYASGLTSIKIPNGITKIEIGTFQFCSNLADIMIPVSITVIGDHAFDGCSSLADVYYQANESDWNIINICPDNTELLAAAIHYNSTGPDDGGDPVDPPVKPPVTPPNPDITDTNLQIFDDVYYYDTIAGTGVNVDLLWSWNYLLLGNPQKYSQSLAKMGLVLSASVEGSTDETAAILINKLECDTAEYNSTSPGAVFAHKTVMMPGGQKEHMIFVVIRGTSGLEDGLNDILTAMGMGDWGAGDVYSKLSSCLAEWSNTYGEINSSNTKFFVTGHSLGGACANIVSARLSESYGTSNVFGYTFATPSPYTHESKNSYTNIHNFLCYNDNVPLRLSLQDPWYGNGYYTWFYPEESSQIAANYTELTGKRWQDTYKEHFFFRLHAPSAYMAFLMTNPDLNRNASNVSYIRAKCPVDIEVYNSGNELVGYIVNNEVVYNNYTSDVMLTVTDGAKCVYFLNDDTYTIKFSGTGDGTMLYTAASKDMNSNTIEEAKVYSNVSIDNGKKLKSVVSSYNGTNTDVLVEIPDVELLVVDDGDNVVARVLSDSEASAAGKNNGTEVPIGNIGNPGGDVSGGNSGSRPGDNLSNDALAGQDDNNMGGSSSKNSRTKAYAEDWKPTTPDEKKRYAHMGKDAVQYTLPKDNAYHIIIENAMQGPMCFKSFEAVLEDYKIGRTYNIYTLPNTVYSTDKEIQFTIKIPSDIYKKDREYKMICVTKGGQPIAYNDLDTNPETITVKTNKFYAYALIYK